jgi:septal ring factor EnvC (AmiA/AmiB activator)
MARLTSIEKENKIKFLKEAIVKLKENSYSLKKNVLSRKTATILANELVKTTDINFNNDISVQTLKNPKTSEFKEIKKEIDDFKIDFKKRKNFTDQKLYDKIKILEAELESVLSKLIYFANLEINLNKELVKKDDKISSLEEQIENLEDRIKRNNYEI